MLSPGRLSVSQCRTDLVALRRLCFTPGGRELRVRARDWDVPRDRRFSCPVAGELGFSLLQPRPGAGEGVEQPAFSTCFNRVIISPTFRTQMHRQREVEAGGRVCLG